MLGSTETVCVESLLEFIKSTPGFRSMTFGGDKDLMENLDTSKVLMLIQGSYLSMDLILGIMVNYDVTDPDRVGSGISMFYRVPGEFPVDVVFVREKQTDTQAKRMGIKTEVEVGQDVIDDNYLILSKDGEGVGRLTKTPAVNEFLTHYSGSLERLEFSGKWLDFQRYFVAESCSCQEIRKDLELIKGVVDSF